MMTAPDAIPTVQTSHTLRKVILSFILVALCAVLPFSGTFNYPFLHDDNMAVVNNPLVDGKSVDMVRLFTTTGWGDVPEYHHVANYRPLATTSLAVTRYAFGLNPVPFRVTNVILYLIVCLVLVWLMYLVGATPLAAGLAGAWFALHGTHVEAVMFVVNREILMALTFYLVGLGIVIKRSALSDRPASWTAASIAGLGAVTLLGLLCKESAVTMPFVSGAVILLSRPTGVRLKNVVSPAAVLILAMAAYFAIRFAALGQFSASAIPWQDNPLVLSATPARLAGAMSLVLLAGRLLVAPFGMTVDYGFDVLGLPGLPPGAPPAQIAGGLFVLCAAAFGLIFLIRKKSTAWPGIAMTAVTWGLVSSIVFPSWIIMGERLLTEPSAGVALAMAVGLTFVTKKPLPAWARTSAVAVIALWIAVMTVLTIDRIPDYRSAKTLFESSLANRPGSTRLHNNMGKVMMDSGRWAQAEPFLRAAIAIDPANAEAHNNLGLVLGNAGRPGSAASAFKEALKHRPNMPAALTNLCILLINLEKYEIALPICRRALSRGGPVEPYIERCTARMGE